jgi:integrase
MQRNWELKDTKTRSSRRKIVLLENTIKVLVCQKEWQEENKNTFDEYEDTGFICTHENGQPINPENMDKAFNKLVKAHNLPQIRFHDIRHTILLLYS